MDPIRICLDFISPYAFVGWELTKQVAARHGRSLEPVPVVFAALLDAHGTRGPAEVPAKRDYVMRDVFRKARRAGLALSPPPTHPFHPITALRVASVPLPGAERQRVIDALFAATWGGGGGVESPAEVTAALTKAGLDAAPIIERASTPSIKLALREATDGAIASGVFGVPTMLVDGELFWGVDSIANLDEHLAGRAGAPAELLKRWAATEPSATR